MTTTIEYFSPQSAMEARLFSAGMLAAGKQAVQLAMAEVTTLLSHKEADDSAAFLRAATSAGALVGKAGYTDALAAVVLDDSLNDSEREQVGFAVHGLARVKEQGVTPGELKQRVQTELAEYAKEDGSDLVQLAVAAFAVGATLEDAGVAGELQAELADMIVERTEG